MKYRKKKQTKDKNTERTVKQQGGKEKQISK